MERSFITAAVDEDGRLVIPADIARKQGIVPGSRVRIREDATGLRVGRSSGSLTRVYLEPCVGLRERLLDFDFAPCTICNSCEEADANRSDCFGNGPPACGGCLRAQGFIQCP